MNLLEQIEAEMVAARERTDVDMRPGDLVRVHVKITEGDKERIQIFEGTVIRIKKGGIRTTFTVRKIASGVGVERIFPASSPNVAKIDIMARHKVRRGETLSSIARRYGTSVSRIKSWNGLRSDRIQSGQVLTVSR